MAMNRTNIEWVKNPDMTQGYTWNPITGCLNGCEYCYAKKLANGRLKSLYLANKNFSTKTPEGYSGYPNLDPFYPRFWPERLGEPIEHPTPLRPAKRKGIFVCDMGELLGDWLPTAWAEQVMTTIKLCPYHRFYLLTKQPQNLPKWSPFPNNCWVGVTATSFHAFANAHYYLKRIEAEVKFLSFEPLLFWGVGASPQPYQEFGRHLRECCDWLIIGAQTKPYKPPRIEWVREIVEAADRAGVPVFLKDNLAPAIPFFKELFCQETMGGDGIRVVGLRQELPKGED